MDSTPGEVDPLSIDSLIEQAEAEKKRWKKPSNEPREHTRVQSWREILEGRTAPKSAGYREV